MVIKKTEEENMNHESNLLRDTKLENDQLKDQISQSYEQLNHYAMVIKKIEDEN